MVFSGERGVEGVQCCVETSRTHVEVLMLLSTGGACISSPSLGRRYWLSGLSLGRPHLGRTLLTRQSLCLVRPPLTMVTATLLSITAFALMHAFACVQTVASAFLWEGES